MNRSLALLAVILSVFLVLTPLAFGKRIKPQPAVITGAEPDLASGEILISGRNVGDTDPFPGTVTLFVPTQGDVELEVFAFDALNQEIWAYLPDGIGDYPGTFLLTVSLGNFSDDFNVTIGETAPPGAFSFYTRTTTITLRSQYRAYDTGVASCDAGDQAVSGGWQLPTGPAPPDTETLVILQTRPEGENSWLVTVVNLSGLAGVNVTVYARCVDVTP